MNTYFTRRKLFELTDFQKIPVEEYQDKYYLLKKIKNLFPDLSNDKIMNAIDYANKEIKAPGKRKKFIFALGSKIFTA